jgi:hypothetical protein
MTRTHALVRAIVGIALSLALTACLRLSIPEDLPTIALGQASLYRLEIALAVFYGCLLILTPAHSGLARGRLPIEISTRGAKFAEESDLAADRYETSIAELEKKTDRLGEDLERANWAVGRLKEEGVTGHDER